MNEITIKCAPRFAGMENRREYEKVTTELELAKARHPKAVRKFYSGAENDSCEKFNKSKMTIRLVNSMDGGIYETGYTVLLEEIYEAFEELTGERWQAAYTELAQVAAVAIRLMEKVRVEHLEMKG